jgi:hypothetical protein
MLVEAMSMAAILRRRTSGFADSRWKLRIPEIQKGRVVAAWDMQALDATEWMRLQEFPSPARG